MTKIELVKLTLSKVNSRFTTKDAHKVHARFATTEEMLTPEQVGKALKGIKYVKGLGGGKFSIRGRRVER